MPCEHENFQAVVEINRLAADDGGAVLGLSAEIHAWCTDCDEPVLWFVPDVGLLRDRPTISPNAQEMRVPCRVGDQPGDFGLDLPGFLVRREP
jgi:hypothetical protein